MHSPSVAVALWQDSVSQEQDSVSQEEQVQDTSVLFSSHDLLEFTIEFDWRTVTRDIDTLEAQEHPAVITFTDEAGEERRFDIKVRTRGHFRRIRRNCEFPPLWLNFPKSQMTGTVFQNQNRVKLYDHCQNGRDDYEQYVIQEYLANRILNTVMDLSLRVRLARVTYVDTEGNEDTLTKFGFFAEHKNELEARTNTEEMELMGVSGHDIDPYTMGLVNMYEYMIGNADWGVPALHNIMVFEGDNFEYYAVPYDFDCTGIVNPRYASRCAGMICTDDMRRRNIPCRRRVTERLYRGFCGIGSDDEQLALLQPYIDIFIEKKDEIYALYTENQYLEEDEIEDSVKYLDDFYKTLDDRGKMRNEFVRKCRR
ncbi:MAG: hypothetical protein O7E49_09105 [Gemmatimonadetes bacterium]|nr:hypothetical protein [Gemmatimonadota bacterium]